MEKDKILVVLFGIWKRQIIFELKYKKEKTNSDEGLLYAFQNDMYPYLDLNHELINLEELEIFESFFKIQKEFFEKICDEIDKSYVTKNYKTFYYWEDFFKKENIEIDRSDLIVFFDYCFKEKRFNDEFRKVLIDHNHNPDEANY